MAVQPSPRLAGPPPGFVPSPGWRADPSWPSPPAGWNFWVYVEDEASDREVPPPSVVPVPVVAPLTQLVGDDGRIELDGGILRLTFDQKLTGKALKRAVAVRSYPLRAVRDLQVTPAGHRGHPTVRVVPEPGRDLLRPLLKNQRPAPDADPDTLVLGKRDTLERAQAFAETVLRRRAALAADGPCPADDAWVNSGKLPVSAKGVNTRAVFDGTTVTIEVTSWTASPERKNRYPRQLPARAVADVVIEHPGLTGKLRFVLAGGPGRDALVDPKTDLNTIELTSDAGQSYAVLAAAVLAAGRTAGVTVHPELLDQPTPAARSYQPADAPAGALAPTPQSTRSSWRDRRDERRAIRGHNRELSAWRDEQDKLDRLAAVARDAGHGRAGVGHGVLLKAGEAALFSGSASLVEPRRQPGHYVNSHSSVSFRVAKGVRYSVGGSRGRYVPGAEVQSPVDSGRFVITTSRVVFTGARTTREWLFSKLISLDASKRADVVLLHVANRQKVSGLALGKQGDEFTAHLALGVAIFQHGVAAVVSECLRNADEHRQLRPQP